MKRATCETFTEALRREPELLGDELAEHARSCRRCGDELRAAGWLRQAAAETTAEARRPLPSASQLWWKAEIIRRLTEREELAEKAVRPVRWSQWAALAAGGAVLALLAIWAGTGLGDLDPAMLASASGWRGLLGFFVLGTVLPLAGFGVLWMLWRDA